ncbi:EutN/CcmL family microcompartment protein [Geosporobacter ferrireducens]|uniref:Ethanolamine utilization protein EutN n=1 Tax=Geosporobacter ferrireducens TaxID=1424294 RepID=A0A1D8GP43_9FIRM|nr:EutN/CcmL family microcompartment protein [Geosporobacter ferrireducens]AOT72719.1 ethanolamine utilization protein EutN [Geosporobacter ferrireducens]MTI55128.1 ethanolamine utilization protein EutN [Geosporobacter ferrireducens]
MYLGKVVGMVVATRKDETLVGKKLLIVQPVNPKEDPVGNPEVAIDSVGAGVGEYVLVSKGSPARQIFGNPNSPIDAAIVGIIDTIEVSE